MKYIFENFCEDIIDDEDETVSKKKTQIDDFDLADEFNYSCRMPM